MAVTHKLEISFDPLSDLSPTWTDVSSRLLEVPSIKFGVDDDLGEMQSGTATFRLDNRDRALEPGYAAGAYFPNVRPLRRIRYLINDGSTDWPQFFGYIVSWGPDWPGGMNQEAVISAVDGTMILEMDKLPGLDPPAASTYEEVVMHDEPFAYYKLGEAFGTAAAAVTGPEATYKNTPTLGAAGLIVGEQSTSVLCGSNEGATASLVDSDHFADRDSFSIEAVVQPAEAGSVGFGAATAFGAATVIGAVGGEEGTSYVANTDTGSSAFSTTVPTNGVTNHVVATFESGTLRLYVDGVLEDTVDGLGDLNAMGATPVARIGNFSSGTGDDVRLQHVAFYEHALSPERVLAHYQASSTINGFAAELAGERVVSAVDNPLWSTAFIDLGAHMVQPTMKHGQSALEAVKDAVRAEFPSSLFFFPGTQHPRYLGWEFGDTAPYNAVQATFGNNPGEIPFAHAETTDEDEIYNIVTTAREGGLAQTATDADSVSEFFDRNYDLTGLIHTEDMSCMEVSNAILAFHSQPDPPVLIKSLTLTSTDTSALAEILERMPGELIRVKHRPQGGTAIDIVTRIRGRNLNVGSLEDGGRVITCTWTLAKGFDAAAGFWRAGIVGFSEAGDTTVAA